MKTILESLKNYEWKDVHALFRQRKDARWSVNWLCGLTLLWIWDALFLNDLSYRLIQSAIFNTCFGAISAVVMTLFFGWSIAVALYILENSRRRGPYLSVIFMMNIIRSIPQIIGLLIGYVILTIMISNGVLHSASSQIIWMSFVISIFCSLEVSDLIRERIAYFKKSDYFHAMLCCGIKESRIINVEILWKSSIAYLIHKIVSLFGVVILLQCSIDFIISVGLSVDVSLSNFPTTLGSLLAKLDSKQDILALGSIFSKPSYIVQMFFQHLQGVSIAFIIIFTLFCIYQIADGLVKQYDL